MMALSIVKMYPGVSWNVVTGMCVTARTTPRFIGVWASPLLFELLVLLSTLLNALDRPQQSNLPLTKALYRDGISYFFAVTSFRVLNLTLAITARPSMIMLGVFLVWAMTTTILNRSLLRLRRTELKAAEPLLVITSSISASAVITLLTVISLSAWNTRKSQNPQMFVRSHAAAYLVSLLLCDLIQALGSLMNAKWYMNHAVEFDSFCVAQGVVKHISDVGTAIWSLVIAAHTFWVLFLRWDLRRYVMIATMIFGWSLIGTLVIAGPATGGVKVNGPFFAISGYWCWISDQYPAAHVALDYMWMFISVTCSFILYSLVFLRLRGNILVDGWRMRFRLHRNSDVRAGVGYAMIILPIAAVRFSEWSGHEVSFAATIFSDTVYLLSGVVNVSLFFFTRRVLPRHSVITKRFHNDHNSDVSPEVASVTMSGRDTPDSFIGKEDYSLDLDDLDEKMIRHVDSPDADDVGAGFPAPARPSILPVYVPPTLDLTSPHSSGLGGFARISLESRRYTADRAEFPASSTGPLVYPQSPITTQSLRDLRSPASAPSLGSPRSGSFKPTKF
ncbi:hypothetical protein EW026_g2346 [Hermanssonia centrifuga]|uniref:G-protein coupled receptors family 2 profile 2 domain-containing protein n=1 Tax=Hermanssonia centrifuga TaxID=98765 RepID=A0A4S4KQL4_9APHY|nr:hypothetical protein EW026_g2346 [Hermanssonia centrifuga]